MEHHDLSWEISGKTEEILLRAIDEFFDSYQPERSKREDIEDLGHDFVTVGCTDHRYCVKCAEEYHVVKTKMMRCSELYGDIERPAEKIWPANCTIK